MLCLGESRPASRIRSPWDLGAFTRLRESPIGSGDICNLPNSVSQHVLSRAHRFTGLPHQKLTGFRTSQLTNGTWLCSLPYAQLGMAWSPGHRDHPPSLPSHLRTKTWDGLSPPWLDLVVGQSSRHSTPRSRIRSRPDSGTFRQSRSLEEHPRQPIPGAWHESAHRLPP